MQVPTEHAIAVGRANQNCASENYQYDLAGLARTSCRWDRLRVEIRVSGPGLPKVAWQTEISALNTGQVTVTFPSQFQGPGPLQSGTYSIEVLNALPTSLRPALIFEALVLVATGTATVR